MLSDQIFAVAKVVDQAVLYLLLILSVVSIGMILERWIALRKIAASSNQMRERIKAAIASHSLDDVEKLSKDPETLEGRAMSFAMKHMNQHGAKGLDEVFNSFALAEKPELERSLNFLATMGNNAPYIGLFGTVLGIMKAFNDLANSAEAGQQTVMAGISMALVATAAGLFVAIPAVFAYNYFSRQVRGIMQSLEAVKELCLAYAKRKA